MAAPVTDPFGRKITYLRVSVTDRCDLRCVRCMAEDMTFLPRSEILSIEELDRICSASIRLGVRTLRLTGGEPLVRRNITSFLRSFGRHLQSGVLDDLTSRPTVVSSRATPARSGTRACVRSTVASIRSTPHIRGDHALGQARPRPGRHRSGAAIRPPRRAQRGGAQGCQ